MARYLLDVSSNDVVVVSEDDDYSYTTLIAQTADDEQGIAKPLYESVGYDDSNVTLAAPVVTALGEFTSGTPKQDATGKESIVYIQITGGTAGTVEVQTSPDGTTYVTLVAATAANAVASQVIPVHLAPFAYLKVTLSVATAPAAVQVTR